MDIEYLLLLQQFRNNINDALTPFMESISFFAVSFLIMIPIFIYWAIDKKKGLYTLVSYFLCCGFNAMVKLTACVYRPWIKDSRVLPAGDAITTATGYSFPSGHTSTAGPIYGGLAVSYKNTLKWFSALCIIAIIITAFSRNYLGVHTPQDVIVALIESVLALFVTAKIFRFIEANPEKENIFLLVSFIVGWLGIIYITFKSYPMDYADGKLLVDPQKMMNDGYGDISLLIAFPVARFIEKTWIKFKPSGLNVFGIITGVIGIVPMYFWIGFAKAPLDAALGSHWGHFCHSSGAVLYAIMLYPLCIKAFQKLKSQKN